MSRRSGIDRDKPVDIVEVLQWIRDDVRSIMGRYDKMDLTWDGGNLSKVEYSSGGIVLLTLTLTWTAGNLTKIERT